MSKEYELATEADKEELLQLYQMQVGREFCPWDEHYPSMHEIEFDLGNDSLLIKKNEAGEIIAAVSIDQDENVDGLTCWSKALLPGGELARLAVRVDCQNQGIARQMLICGMEELRLRGYKSVHFMVNKYNEKALRSYRHLEFEKVGECFMYEQPFYCYEKAI